METQVLMLIIISALFLCIVVCISLLIGILGRYAFYRKGIDKSHNDFVGSPVGSPKSLGLLFMRMTLKVG